MVRPFSCLDADISLRCIIVGEQDWHSRRLGHHRDRRLAPPIRTRSDLQRHGSWVYQVRLSGTRTELPTANSLTYLVWRTTGGSPKIRQTKVQTTSGCSKTATRPLLQPTKNKCKNYRSNRRTGWCDRPIRLFYMSRQLGIFYSQVPLLLHVEQQSHQTASCARSARTRHSNTDLKLPP